MNNLSLYELAEEYRDVAEKLSSLDMDDDTIADTLESISGDLEGKIINLSLLVKNIDGFTDQISTVKNSLDSRQVKYEKKSEAIRKHIFDSIKLSGIKTVESPEVKVSIKKNPASVVIDDEKEIPAKFMKYYQTPPATPDKNKIKEELKKNQDVPGCRLVQKDRLEIE